MSERVQKRVKKSNQKKTIQIRNSGFKRLGQKHIEKREVQGNIKKNESR